MDFKAMTDDERWEAVQARDKAQDGRFVTGVLTTGIYCRPSCAARHPLRENVRFFPDGDAARATGLRPCKRCLPDDVARDENAVIKAIAAIKGSEEPARARRSRPPHRLFADAFPARLHAPHRLLARGLCPRAARRTRAAGAERGQPGDRRDLRRRIFGPVAFL